MINYDDSVSEDYGLRDFMSNTRSLGFRNAFYIDLKRSVVRGYAPLVVGVPVVTFVASTAANAVNSGIESIVSDKLFIQTFMEDQRFINFVCSRPLPILSGIAALGSILLNLGYESLNLGYERLVERKKSKD